MRCIFYCTVVCIAGDVVGCYLAMENGWVDISFTVNGRFCGSAFKIRWMTDEVHIYLRHATVNCLGLL